MTLTEVQELMLLAKKIGAKKFRYKDLVMEFAGKEYQQSELGEALQEDIQPTEDQLLYWSTDYQPDIKASAPE